MPFGARARACITMIREAEELTIRRKRSKINDDTKGTKNAGMLEEKEKRHGKFEKSSTMKTGKCDITSLAADEPGKRLRKQKHAISGVTEKGSIVSPYKEKNVRLKKRQSSKTTNSSTVQSVSSDKPNWLELRKRKKELKEKRRARKFTNIYDISVNAKQISEKLRRKDCTPLSRRKLVAKLHELLETHYRQTVFVHDLSRIIQLAVRYCDAETRETIFNELKPSLVSMFESKYAKNCIKSILQYGSKEMRHQVVSACYGHVLKLISHNIAAPLFELVYAKWATERERLYLKQEFYGDVYKGAKDRNIASLSDIFEGATNMKLATLSAVKANLLRIVNKNLIKSTLMQNVLLEFLSNCSSEDRSEMIAILRASILELSKFKYGAKIAAICIWHGSQKDRKFMIKSLKRNVQTIATSEHGYTVLLALIDCVDDTVLLRKVILAEVLENLHDIAFNEYGKHVILYLVARRDPRYFPPSTVEFLKQGDSNAISKKPRDLREKELLEFVIDTLLQSIITDTRDWFSNSSISMVAVAILKVGYGERSKRAFESVAALLTTAHLTIKEDNKEYVAIEHSGLHMALKKLIQNDRNALNSGQTSFGEVLINGLTKDVLEGWFRSNRGCFLLVLLIENEPEGTVDILLSKLRPLLKSLDPRSSLGASVLEKKIQ